MDISKYRKYIRNLSISDEDLEDMIKDIIEDIARDTKIFKDYFAFTLSECVSDYNIKYLYDGYKQNQKEYELETVSPVSDPDLLVQFINSIYGEKCNTVSLVSETYTEVETELENNTLLHVNQIVEVNNNQIKNLLDGDLLYLRENFIVTMDTGKFKQLYVDTDYLPVLCSVTIIPDLDKISDNTERIIRTAIINGIKYFLSDTYSDPNGAQVGNILYQRYYSSKKQLLYNYPVDTFVMPYKNEEWNI